MNASFAPSLALLDRVVAKYRRDVHTLNVGASLDAVRAAEHHLQSRLPHGLRQFLNKHNGARLFRGSLNLRSTSELTTAGTDVSQVVLFADDADQSWGFACDAALGFVFGKWRDNKLYPMHTSFPGWLAGAVAVLESRVVTEVDRDALRWEADSDDLLQQVLGAERSLAAGRPEDAESLLGAVTKNNTVWPRAWQLWGDALAINDRSAARQAWLEAFRHTRLPVAYPGASLLDPSVLRSISGAFGDGDEFDAELVQFLEERVKGVESAGGHTLLQAVLRTLARHRTTRGRREEARDVLLEWTGRVRKLGAEPMWEALLDLVRLQIDLGCHDEAEALMRRIRREGPTELAGRTHLALAELATLRQEPWAEDIFNDAVKAGLDAGSQLKLKLLIVERLLRQEKILRAEAALADLEVQTRKHGDPVLRAHSDLVHGDVHRMKKEHGRAASRYQQAQEKVGERDLELCFRVHLRLSDLARSNGDLANASKQALTAAGGFHHAGLPVREAWALVRLAQLERDPAKSGKWLERALELFVKADLAAGVAAVDSLAGDPGRSLDWHLRRAAEHARSRHDAQRPKAPWERCDADRPERRLGAHRLAVAACSNVVVRSLKTAMDDCVRATDAGRVKLATDPAVMRYIGAVDLLSGHRSFESSEVLLGHLLDGRVEGVARRSLLGAVARSPNAALVDGLLRCVEEPQKRLATAVASAAEVLGLRREAAALPALCHLARSDKARTKARRAAVVALGRIGNRETVSDIAVALDVPELAEPAALALLMLGDRRGVDFHARALLENRSDMAGHPGEIVGRYGGPDHLLVLGNATRGETQMALGALQGLGLMGDSRGVKYLLEALHSRNRQVVGVASMALTLLTGREDDPEDPGVRTRWHQYWEKEGWKLPENIRHRSGKVFGSGDLIAKMSHSDSFTRRTAYDELVIATGQSLPFDADGPWRIQQSHLRAWHRWWAKAKHGCREGRWYLDGKVLH